MILIFRSRKFSNRSSIKDAINELLIGATDEENNRNIISCIPKGTELLDIFIEGNTVYLIAKVTMFESIQKIKGEEITQEQAKIENQEITETTTNLVTTIVDMLSKNTETQKVFDELRNYSDGGVMSHSNRVFISYVNFMAFYNNLINRRHLVHKIRTSYTNKYKKFYEQVETMFSKDSIRKNLATVEDCIDKGIKIIEEREMNLYSVGALLHDIGKVKDLDYFEGANGRDYERIKKHLFNNYFSYAHII